jgi:hypothetical protein
MQRKQAFSSSMSDATLEKPQLFLNKRPKTSPDEKHVIKISNFIAGD